MADVLLVTDGFFHPPRAARRQVHYVLAEIPGCQFKHTSSLNELPKFDMSRFAALVLYYHHKRLAPEALVEFQQFVRRGGGVLAIHSATASFKNESAYFDMIGGRFTGHGPVETFEIRPENQSETVFEGIGSFSVKDELYLHELRPGVKVEFSALYESKPQPLVWTHQVGRGRVCYVGPGHTTATMKNRSMEEILRRGLQWVLGI